MVQRALALSLLPTLSLSVVEIPTKLIADDLHMPVISIGVGGTEKNEAKTIVSSWLSLGGRGIDTAAYYKNSEEVAEAIAESGISREDIFLTSKIPGCDDAEAEIQKLLQQLNTTYLDLLLIHFPSGDCATAWATMEKYHAQGALKGIGVSNFERSDIDALKTTLKVTPLVNQVKLNVLSYNDDTINASSDTGILMEAYSPLGRGGVDDIPGNPTIQTVAASHNVSTYQVALKWILQKGYVLTFQSSNPDHQESNANLFGFDLNDGEMQELDSLQMQENVIV